MPCGHKRGKYRKDFTLGKIANTDDTHDRHDSIEAWQCSSQRQIPCNAVLIL